MHGRGCGAPRSRSASAAPRWSPGAARWSPRCPASCTRISAATVMTFSTLVMARRARSRTIARICRSAMHWRPARAGSCASSGGRAVRHRAQRRARRAPRGRRAARSHWRERARARAFPLARRAVARPRRSIAPARPPASRARARATRAARARRDGVARITGGFIAWGALYVADDPLSARRCPRHARRARAASRRWALWEVAKRHQQSSRRTCARGRAPATSAVRARSSARRPTTTPRATRSRAGVLRGRRRRDAAAAAAVARACTRARRARRATRAARAPSARASIAHDERRGELEGGARLPRAPPARAACPRGRPPRSSSPS